MSEDPDEYGVPWCITLSLDIVGGSLGGLGREGGDCGYGKANRGRYVFPISKMRPSSDDKYGVLAYVPCITVTGVADVACSGRDSGYYEDL